MCTVLKIKSSIAVVCELDLYLGFIVSVCYLKYS